MVEVGCYDGGGIGGDEGRKPSAEIGRPQLGASRRYITAHVIAAGSPWGIRVFRSERVASRFVPLRTRPPPLRRPHISYSLITPFSTPCSSRSIPMNVTGH